jgi:MFS family permease
MPSDSVSSPVAMQDRTRWGIVLIAFGAGMVAAGHIGKLPAALPTIRAELGLDLVTAGWIVSIFNAITFLLGMMFGIFADRLGHRRMILTCLLMLAVGSLWGAGAGSGIELLLARFTEGIGFVGVVVSAPSIIAHAAQPRDRRFALGIWGAFMPAGMATMLLIAPAILAPFGWRVLWVVIAVATLLWALVTGVALRSYDSGGGMAAAAAAADPQASTWKIDLRLTLSRGGLWVLALSFAFYALQWMALMVWLPTFLVEQRGASIALAAHLTVIVVLVNAIGNLLGGWLLQRGAARWQLVVFVGLLSIACGFAIFTDLLPDWLRYAACILFSGLAGMLPAAAMSGAPAFAPTPRQIGAANGLLVQGSNLGQLIGPPAIAAMVSIAGGWQAGSWVFFIDGVAILVLATFLLRLERTRSAGAERRVISSAD